MGKVMTDPGNVLLSGTVDNNMYGLLGVEPQILRIGVFAAPTQDLHTMNGPLSFVDTDNGQFFEAARFCRIAVQGDLGFTTFLHLPAYDCVTELGQELLDIRHRLLSAKSVRSETIEEASDCIEDMDVRLGDFSPEAKQRTSDAAQHLLRILWQGFHLYSTGYFPMRVDEPKRFLAFGQRVANGMIDDARQVIAEYSFKFSVTPSALREDADLEAVDRWLRFVRLRFL